MATTIEGFPLDKVWTDLPSPGVSATEMGGITTSTGLVGSWSLPRYSKWSCTIAGSLTFKALEGQEPNFFHRWTQRLALGFVWKKDA